MDLYALSSSVYIDYVARPLSNLKFDELVEYGNSRWQDQASLDQVLHEANFRKLNKERLCHLDRIRKQVAALGISGALAQNLQVASNRLDAIHALSIQLDQELATGALMRKDAEARIVRLKQLTRSYYISLNSSLAEARRTAPQAPPVAKPVTRPTSAVRSVAVAFSTCCSWLGDCGYSASKGEQTRKVALEAAFANTVPRPRYTKAEIGDWGMAKTLRRRAWIIKHLFEDQRVLEGDTGAASKLAHDNIVADIVMVSGFSTID